MIASQAQTETCGSAWTSICGFGKRVGLTALAGSNPASSAKSKHYLISGNADHTRSAWDGVASNIEAASLSPGLSFRPPICPRPRLSTSKGARRCSPTYASPNQLATKAGWSRGTQVGQILRGQASSLGQHWMDARASPTPEETAMGKIKSDFFITLDGVVRVARPRGTFPTSTRRRECGGRRCRASPVMGSCRHTAG